MKLLTARDTKFVREAVGIDTETGEPAEMEDLPIVVEVVEINGKPYDRDESEEEEGAEFVLNCSDWGGLDKIFYVISDTGFGSHVTSAVIRALDKKTGDVQFVMHINALELDMAGIDALRLLTRDRWRADLELSADARELLTDEMLTTLHQWAFGVLPAHLKIESRPREEPVETDPELDRREFLDLLDFVNQGILSELAATEDLPPGCDAELFSALAKRNQHTRRAIQLLQDENTRLTTLIAAKEASRLLKETKKS